MLTGWAKLNDATFSFLRLAIECVYKSRWFLAHTNYLKLSTQRLEQTSEFKIKSSEMMLTAPYSRNMVVVEPQGRKFVYQFLKHWLDQLAKQQICLSVISP